jgi:cell division septum initiation protein DivIVA
MSLHPLVRYPTPMSLRPLVRYPFTPYITDGKTNDNCCNILRPMFGCEVSRQECTSALFRPPAIEKLEADESDLCTAQRILDALEYQRRDMEHMAHILPSSPYEGLEFREKLKECDTLGSRILEIKTHRFKVTTYEKKKTEFERLGDLLPSLQSNAERAGPEKSRKEHQLHRKRLRRQVLEEEASARQQYLEEQVERRRQVEGVDTEQLLGRPRGRTIRRLREVEIPSLGDEIKDLERDVRDLERTVEEYRRSKDTLRDLNAYLTSNIPGEMNVDDEESSRRRLREARLSLMDRSRRMFRYLLDGKPEDYETHEKDFDEFYESIESGCCTCGRSFVSHRVLLTHFTKESDKLEQILRDYLLNGSDEDTLDR